MPRSNYLAGSSDLLKVARDMRKAGDLGATIADLERYGHSLQAIEASAAGDPDIQRVLKMIDHLTRDLKQLVAYHLRQSNLPRGAQWEAPTADVFPMIVGRIGELTEALMVTP